MSFRDLRRNSAEIDEHDTADLPGGTDPAVASRRSFLRRAATGGVIAAGAAAVPVTAMIPSALAQSTTPGTGGTTSGTTPGTAIAGTSVPPKTATKKDPPTVKGDDLDIVVFMQTIELAAQAAFEAMVATGKFSSPVAEAARVAGMQHRDHADAMDPFAGSEALNRPNATLAGQLLPRITDAKTARDLAQIAYDLEEAITASWSAAMADIEEWEVAEVAATIMPVTSQQALD